MGNLGSSLFATPQEKEFRKLTKKNTRVNRVSLSPSTDTPEPLSPTPRDPERKKRMGTQPLRFENLITEVTYDRDGGEFEVTRESLNLESDDALGTDLILDLVPTTVPVVSASDDGQDSDLPPRLKRDSSFISAHARRHGTPLSTEVDAHRAAISQDFAAGIPE